MEEIIFESGSVPVVVAAREKRVKKWVKAHYDYSIKTNNTM